MPLVGWIFPAGMVDFQTRSDWTPQTACNSLAVGVAQYWQHVPSQLQNRARTPRCPHVRPPAWYAQLVSCCMISTPHDLRTIYARLLRGLGAPRTPRFTEKSPRREHTRITSDHSWPWPLASPQIDLSSPQGSSSSSGGGLVVLPVISWPWPWPRP